MLIVGVWRHESWLECVKRTITKRITVMSTPTEAFIIKQVYALVVEEMRLGSDRFSIAEKLESMGVEPTEASALVESVYREAKEVVFDERPNTLDVVQGAVGGMLMAVLGGAIWAALATISEVEVGFLAWGIGAACGYAVVKAAKGRRGLAMQLIAVASSVFGFLLAKYGTFFFSLKQLFIEELGLASVLDMTMFSTAILGIFLETLPSMLNPWIALWVMLSIATAWLIPKSYFPLESPLNYRDGSL